MAVLEECRLQRKPSCSSSNNGRFGRTYCLHHQGEKIRDLEMLAVTSNVLPTSLNLFTVIMKAILRFETSVVITATRRHIPRDGTLYLTHVDDLLIADDVCCGFGRPGIGAARDVTGTLIHASQ
jgi:hypothetical protein